jgi:hypothetical protein
MNALRGEILSEIVQHPATLLPLATSILSGVWTLAFRPSAITIIGMVAGGALTLIGALYNLLFNGPVLRDRILARWESEAEQEEQLTRLALRNELLLGDNAVEQAKLYDSFEQSAAEARHMLDTPGVATSVKLHFEPLIEDNYRNAIALFNKLAHLSKRCDNLRQGGRAAGNSTKLERLAHQREQLLTHLRAVTIAFDRIVRELPMDGASGLVEVSERDRQRLEETLDLTRAAEQRLREELKPISGLHRKDLV